MNTDGMTKAARVRVAFDVSLADVLAMLGAVALVVTLLLTGRTATARTFGTILVELLVLFVVVSFFVAMAQGFVGPDRLQRWLGGNRLVGMGKGIALGAVTPFCSCSTVPVLAGLLRAGVPFAKAAGDACCGPAIVPEEDTTNAGGIEAGACCAMSVVEESEDDSAVRQEQSADGRTSINASRH